MTTRSTSAPKRKFDFLDPSELPGLYIMICEGTCLEPEIRDGASLIFDKNAPFIAGDLVGIFRRPELVQPGHHQMIVKRLVGNPGVSFPHRDHPQSEIRAMLMAEQLNPGRRFYIPCEEIIAVYKCLGPVPKGTKRIKMTEAETRALNASKEHRHEA